MNRRIELLIAHTATWQSSGMHVVTGQIVVASYEPAELPSNPASATGTNLLESAPKGALLGKIGETVFQIASGVEFPADLGGELQLAFNCLEGSIPTVPTMQVILETNWPVAIQTVTAAPEWQSTGIDVKKGDHLSFIGLSGRWLPDPNLPYCNVEGQPAGAGKGGSRFPSSLYPKGALIGRVGDKIFLIGRGGRILGRSTGPLHLRANSRDCNPAHTLGTINVEIRSRAAHVDILPERVNQTNAIPRLGWQSTGVLTTKGPPTVTVAPAYRDGLRTEWVPLSPVKGKPEMTPAGERGEVLVRYHGTLAEGETVPATVERHLQVAGYRSCLSFEGKTTWLRLTPPMNPVKIKTIMCWAYLYPDGKRHAPLLSGYDSAEGPARFQLSVNPLTFSIRDTASDTSEPELVRDPDSTASGNLQQWTHLAVVANGKKMTLYRNGIEVASASQSIASETLLRRLYVGGTGDPSDTFLSGSLCELSYWSTALSPAKVKSLAKRALRGTEDGLIQYWPLNEGTGLSVVDRTLLKPGMIRDSATWATPWRHRIVPVRPIVKKRVLAKGGWQSTGIEALTQHASKTIRIRVDKVSWRAKPTGKLHDAAGSGVANSSYPLPEAKVGQLIARIGSHVFAVGNSVTAPAGLLGSLQLMINAKHDELHQNEGYAQVLIIVEPLSRALMPHQQPTTAYSGTRNSLISQAKLVATNTIQDSQQDAQAKIDKAHTKMAAELQSASYALDVLFAVSANKIDRVDMPLHRSAEAIKLTKAGATASLAPPAKKAGAPWKEAIRLPFPPLVAVQQLPSGGGSPDRIYWMNTTPWDARTSISLFSAQLDGSMTQKREVPIGTEGAAAVACALAIDSFRGKLYVLYRTPGTIKATGDPIALTVIEEALVDGADRREVATLSVEAPSGRSDKEGNFVADPPRTATGTAALDGLIEANRWWMVRDSQNQRLFLCGGGAIFRAATDSASSVKATAFTTNKGYAVAPAYDQAGDSMYWIDALNASAYQSDSSGKINEIGKVDALGLAIDPRDKRGFVSNAKGIQSFSLTEAFALKQIVSGSGYTELLFSDPEQNKQNQIADAQQRRKDAVLSAAEEIRKAHEKATKDKSEKTAQLGEAQEAANTKRATARADQNKRLKEPKANLLAAQAAKTQKIAAANDAAATHKRTALDNKAKRIADANKLAADKKAGAKKILDAAHHGQKP